MSFHFCLYRPKQGKDLSFCDHITKELCGSLFASLVMWVYTFKTIWTSEGPNSFCIYVGAVSFDLRLFMLVCWRLRLKEEKVLKAKIYAKGMTISIVSDGSYDDYISLTDIAKYKSEDPAATIQNWMRSRDVIEFLGLWETLHNPGFNLLEFEGFKSHAGSNAFTLSPKRWLAATAAIGMYSKSGRNGGTYGVNSIW